MYITLKLTFVDFCDIICYRGWGIQVCQSQKLKKVGHNFITMIILIKTLNQTLLKEYENTEF